MTASFDIRNSAFAIRPVPSTGNANFAWVQHFITDPTEANDWGKRYYHGKTDGSDAGAVDPTELKGYVE